MNAFFPYEAIVELEEEWWMVVDESLNSFDKKFICGYYSKRYWCKEKNDVEDLIDELRAAMKKPEVKMIKEAIVED